MAVFDLITSGIVLRSLLVKSPLRRIDRDRLASSINLPLVKLPIFTSLGTLFLPVSTSPKVLALFSFPAHFVGEICVVCFSLELVIEHDNRVCDVPSAHIYNTRP